MSEAVAAHGAVEPAETPLTPESWGKLGMWLFLGTEVLLFSGMFCAYFIFRLLHPERPALNQKPRRTRLDNFVSSQPRFKSGVHDKPNHSRLLLRHDPDWNLPPSLQQGVPKLRLTIFGFRAVVHAGHVARRQVGQLVDDGVREVTLLGQNVNAYGRDLGRRGAPPCSFAHLLERLDAARHVGEDQISQVVVGAADPAGQYPQ
jgi:hypothetical protein